MEKNDGKRTDTSSTSASYTKAVRHYSKKLPKETIEFLNGIAKDYAKVKNYTYSRYSGIGSMDKLTPVYTVLNETRASGMRKNLDLPVVYFELAVADAVRDIKSRWGVLKNKLNSIITANGNLSDTDKMYLRTVLKINTTFADILNRRPYKRPDKVAGEALNEDRLNNYLRRVTRKHLTKMESARSDYFRVTPAGYSFKNGEFKLVSRVPRQRIAVPLKDACIFDRQILVKICADHVEIDVPVERKPKSHPDYVNAVYAHIGSRNMITLSNGHIYGKDLDTLASIETDRLVEINKARNKVRDALARAKDDKNEQKARHIETNNLGHKKYKRMKDRGRGISTTFINTELNRLIKEEKPEKIVITKRVMHNGRIENKSFYKTSNVRQSRSFASYIRKRLACKCKDNSIELVEINSKGTGSTCSVCGGAGKFIPNEGFACSECGCITDIGLNSARNIEKKYKVILCKDEDKQTF